MSLAHPRHPSGLEERPGCVGARHRHQGLLRPRQPRPPCTHHGAPRLLPRRGLLAPLLLVGPPRLRARGWSSLPSDPCSRHRYTSRVTTLPDSFDHLHPSYSHLPRPHQPSGHRQQILRGRRHDSCLRPQHGYKY
ncbi:hypothetical protein K523DRAFT_277033 [Schizophyllum commune Tattone D]|nr:hypothetical protein K523DRAFT_277033 [Schizophyllum commune Tattone D]